MNKKDLLFFSLLAACIGLVIWTKITAPKVAFVRSAVVVDGYLGMKEARKIIDSKMGEWQSNIDTLNYDFERSVNNYQQVYSQLSPKERSEREVLLKNQQDKLEQYKQSIDQKADEESEKITQGVLNQINSFIKEYSMQEGYDVVLGVTLSGNILYGTDGIDITDEVLSQLNNSYQGK